MTVVTTGSQSRCKGEKMKNLTSRQKIMFGVYSMILAIISLATVHLACPVLRMHIWELSGALLPIGDMQYRPFSGLRVLRCLLWWLLSFLGLWKRNITLMIISCLCEPLTRKFWGLGYILIFLLTY